MTGKKYIISTLIAAVIFISAGAVLRLAFLSRDKSKQQIRVGFVYDSDDVTPYTANFIKAQKAAEKKLGSDAQIFVRTNIRENDAEEAIGQLIAEGCDIIFTTAYGYGETAKRITALHPETQFCQAACGNADDEPFCENYHTFMGEIYQGRYISGAVAGMKLNEMIERGEITAGEARLGYVAAFPNAQVISGYTAFLLGARSVCPTAVMEVCYTNTWSNYAVEKKCALRLIDDGCVVISQHSDTTGPAVACEEVLSKKNVCHVGYNQSMTDIAPTSSLISCRINWEPYIVGACEAMLQGRRIEQAVSGNVHGNDIGAGFEQGWVEMLNLNELIAAEGTKEKTDELIEAFKDGTAEVFKGDYTGTDPSDPTRTIDLSSGYIENENSSAPTFSYVLNDVITVVEI